MIHPDTKLSYINDKIGFGVVATRLIPQGTILWVRDDLDQTLTLAEFRALPMVMREALDHYVYLDEEGFVVCWDHARYLNHSCAPNCLSGGYDFEIVVRDIQPGEQVTCDYGAMNPDCVFECHCELPECRYQIYPNDLVTFSAKWDAIVHASFARVRAVAQPLWDLIDDEELEQFNNALDGKEPFYSCRENYLGPNPELDHIWDDDAADSEAEGAGQ